MISWNNEQNNCLFRLKLKQILSLFVRINGNFGVPVVSYLFKSVIMCLLGLGVAQEGSPCRISSLDRSVQSEENRLGLDLGRKENVSYRDKLSQCSDCGCQATKVIVFNHRIFQITQPAVIPCYPENWFLLLFQVFSGSETTLHQGACCINSLIVLYLQSNKLTGVLIFS